MGPGLFLLERLFCLSYCRTCRNMSTDIVGLKICLSETSNSMFTPTILSLVQTEVVLG